VKNKQHTVAPFEWFKLNLRIGALSFGGASRLFLFQEECVEKRHWMSHEDFQEALTMAQAAPGPNLINVSAYMGNKLSGAWGAALGVAALTLPGALFIVLVITLIPVENFWVRILVQGLSLGSVLLWLPGLYKLMKGMRSSHNGKVRSLKFTLRLALSFLIGALYLNGLVLSDTLILGLFLGLIVEFLVHD